MKKLVFLFCIMFIVIIFISGCTESDIKKAPLDGLEQDVRANAGAAISSAGLKTCADIAHSNCVELTTCGDYSGNSDTYFLLMNDISDSMSCLFLADGVILDLNGYTVTYAEGYNMMPNWNFESWTSGSPDNWDVSGASGARQGTKQEMPLLGDYSLYLPNAGSVVVSDWVYLPVGNRHYRGIILYQDGNGGIDLEVLNSGGSVVCSNTYGADFDGEGMVAFCDFDNQPAGNYRIRVTSNSNNMYLDLGGILPAHDHGVGVINYYNDAYCDTYSSQSCYGPDYLSQTGTPGASITVKNGYIDSGSFVHSGFGITSYFMGGASLEVENVIINVSGIDSNAIRTSSSGSISYSELYNYQPWITTRQHLHRAGSVIGSQDFHHNIASGGQGVINVVGENSRIYNNLIENDQSVTNHYAITYSADISDVYNNVFDPIRGSGILVYKSNGVSIYNNIFYSVAQPCDPEYITGTDLTYSTNAIRINDYYSDDTFDTDVYNNDFHIMGEYYTNPEHPGCTPISTGIFFSASGPNNNIFNNRFYTEKRNDNDNLHLYALYMGDATTANVPQDNKLVYNNYFESNDKAVWITSFYGPSIDMWLENNTFSRVDNIYYTPGDYDAAIQIGSGSFDANNLRLINNKFLNGFNPDFYSFTGLSGSYDLHKKSYLHVNVKDDLGNPVINSLVTAETLDLSYSVSDYTNNEGYAFLYLNDYDESGSTNSGGTRTQYGDYNVKANYGGSDYYYASQIDPSLENDIIIILGTGGCTLDEDCNYLDSLPCAEGVCNGGTCEVSHTTNSCNDGIDCTENDICSAGACGPGVPNDLLCPDNPSCTTKTCTITGCSYSDCIVDVDTLLYVPFDSDVNDYSSSNLVSSTVSSPVSSIGFVNGAYLFNGVDNYVEYGDSDIFSLPLTLMGWIKTDKIGHSSIIRTDDDSSYSGAWLEVTSSNKIRAGFGNGGGSVSANRYQLEVSADSIIANHWHHVTAVISGVNDIQIYVDGNPIIGSYSGSATSFSSTNGPISIGRRIVYGIDYFNGNLDEVKIKNIAMTQSQIVEEITGVAPTCTDSDGDTYSVEGGTCGLTDCNDANASINPGASDSNCNGVDEDCSGTPDQDYVSVPTSCGVGECSNSGSTSCVSASVVDSCTAGSPITEVCNGLDDDCDTLIDEELDCGTSISQTINLNSGWNVVSLQLFNSALTSEDFESTYVMKYNNGWISDWSGISGDEFSLEPLRGYYVYSLSDQSIVLSGNPVSSEYSLIDNTWNLFTVNNTISGNGFVASVFDGEFVYSPVSMFVPGGNYWVAVGDVLFGPPFYDGLSFNSVGSWIEWLFNI